MVNDNKAAMNVSFRPCGLRRNHALLLTGTTALIAAQLVCGFAFAQTPVPDPAIQTHEKPKKAMAARPNAAARTGEEDEAITVRSGGIATSTGETGLTPGGGLMQIQTAAKATSGVTRDYIAKQAPTANPAALIASLPGVVYEGTDPLGLDDDQQGLRVRGLDQTEVGYTFEGIPAAAPVYLLPYTSDAADNENIGSLTLTQGSPDPTSPLYNAVGGQLTETYRDPSNARGGYISSSLGSLALNREFLRFDTGLLGTSGVKSFISFSHTVADNWRGSGDEEKYHVDWFTVKNWGEGDSAKFILSFTSPVGYYYETPTLAQWQTLGRRANYASTYTAATASSYYKFEENSRGSLILGAPVSVHLTPNVTLTSTPYYTYAWGYDNYGGTSISTTKSYIGTEQAGAVAAGTNAKTIEVVPEDTFQLRNFGLNNVLKWEVGHNTITAGYWYSYFDQWEPSTYAGVNSNGDVSSQNGDFPLLTTSGQELSLYNVHLIQQVNSLFVGDTFTALNQRLTVNGTFRYTMLSRIETDAIPGASYRNGETDAKPLPQLSAAYKIDDHNQVYADATTSFRASASISTYEDRFSEATGVQSKTHAINIQPEFAIGEEVGYRHYGLFNLSVALFNYNFTNRQLSTTSYIDGLQVGESINAGGQTLRGVDGEFGLKPWHHFSPYLSAQYLHATTDNNIRVGADYVPSKGKTAVESPEFSGALGLSYDDGHVFGMFNATYVGQQYSTFMDDQKVPSYETYNMSMGYRFHSFSALKHPQVSLNLINLGGGAWLSGVSGIQPNAKSVKGVFGTTIAAANPTYFESGGFAAIVTLATGF